LKLKLILDNILLVYTRYTEKSRLKINVYLIKNIDKNQKIVYRCRHERWKTTRSRKAERVDNATR
jgi:hypothetical protein